MHQCIEKIDVNNNQRTAYIYDASGNILAENQEKVVNGQASSAHKTQHMYGFRRLGVFEVSPNEVAISHHYSYMAT